MKNTGDLPHDSGLSLKQTIDRIIALGTQVEENLNISEAIEATKTPDQDLIILKTGDSYAVVKTPALLDLEQHQVGQEMSLSYFKEGIHAEIAGIIHHIQDDSNLSDQSFYDDFHSKEYGAYAITVSVDDMTFPGLIYQNAVDLPYGHVVDVAIEGTNYKILLPYFFDLNLLAGQTSLPITFLDHENPAADAAILDVQVMEEKTWITQVDIQGKSYPARIWEIDSRFDAKNHDEPFLDNVFVEADGKLYQIALSSELSDLTAGEEIRFQYLSTGLHDKEKSESQMVGRIVDFQDVTDDKKFTLSKIKTSLSLVSGEKQDNATLLELLSQKNIFQPDRAFTRQELHRKIRQLGRLLNKEYYQNWISYTWDEAGNSFQIDVQAVVAPQKFELSFATDEREHETGRYDQRGYWETIRKSLEPKLSVPITEIHFRKNLEILKHFFQKHPDFDLTDTRWQIQNGVFEFTPVLIQKPKELLIEIQDGDKTKTYSLNEIFKREEKAIHNPDEQVRQLLHFVSDEYAKTGRILAVEKNGQWQPYLPEWHRDKDIIKLLSRDDSGVIAIQTFPMPKTLELQGLVQPADETVTGFFGDEGLTTAAISCGLDRLTKWYTQNGYELNGGHLNHTIENGKLKIEAPLYIIENDITFLTDKYDGFELKRKTDLKFIARELLIEKGDVFNAHRLQDSISAIQQRFNYLAIPFIERDSQMGHIKIQIQLRKKEELGQVLKNVFLNAGVNTYGFFLGGGLGVQNHAGFKIDTNIGVTLTPGYEKVLSAGSIGASLSTPKDKNGWDFSIGGNSHYFRGLMQYGANVSASHRLEKTNWHVILDGGVSGMQGPFDIEGINALYIKPNIGLRYQDRHWTISFLAGPHFSTQGNFYGEISASVYGRKDLTPSGLYAEVMAKAGLLFGDVTQAAAYHHVPISLHGHFLQPPLFIQSYASLGGALMQEIPGGFADIGFGAKAGIAGAVATIGAGLMIRIKFPIALTLLLGPAIVNGVPVPFTVSFQ